MQSGKCRFLNGTLAPAGRISSFTPVPKNELAMQAAVLNGPVAVSIVANAKLILYRFSNIVTFYLVFLPSCVYISL